MTTGEEPGLPTDLDRAIARLEESREDRKVRISPEMMEVITLGVWATTDNRVSIEWGEPDAEGFYTPTIHVHYAMVVIP